MRDLLYRAEDLAARKDALLRRSTCSQCGGLWFDAACGPTHAAIAAAHPHYEKIAVED